MMVTIHTDPGYGPDPGHEGTGTVTAVVCSSGASQSAGAKSAQHASHSKKSKLKRLLHPLRK